MFSGFELYSRWVPLTEMQGKDGQQQTAFIFNFHQRLFDTLSIKITLSMKIRHFINVRELMHAPMTQEIMRSRVAQCKTRESP